MPRPSRANPPSSPVAQGAGGFAASGAAGGAIDNAEERQVARDTVAVAAQAGRRYSGFTCYAALAEVL